MTKMKKRRRMNRFLKMSQSLRLLKQILRKKQWRRKKKKRRRFQNLFQKLFMRKFRSKKLQIASEGCLVCNSNGEARDSFVEMKYLKQ